MLSAHERRVLVANKVAAILGILSFALLVILIAAFGVNINSPIIFGIGVFFFAIILLNKKGFDHEGRILLCVIPAIITLLAAILAKTSDSTFTDILYYDARFFLVLFGIVPCLVFDPTEYFKLYGCLFVILASLVLFDPLHEFFQVGYYQRGFRSTSYYYINYVSVITLFGVVAGAISLKAVIEKAERENADANKQLTEAMQNLETRNEEIISQSEELITSQEQLKEANRMIEIQKVDLQRQVTQVNSDLQETNEELIRHNNELRQFSYTISHNLRGPIARLLGLTNLMNMNEKTREDQETMTVVNYIKTSALELDNVIRDLNSIIDTTSSIYQKKQRIEFDQEWGEIKRLLHISPEMEADTFKVDFSAAPHIYSVKAMVNSIIYNLISNAVKYQSSDRRLLVSLTTYHEGANLIISVKDNGLGIDLRLFRKDLFKMYKRFHDHQEGKGLGLYLVNSQAIFLNGFVEVFSQPDDGAHFKVHIRNSQE